jgi:hypothetical protein
VCVLFKLLIKPVYPESLHALGAFLGVCEDALKIGSHYIYHFHLQQLARATVEIDVQCYVYLQNQY